MLVANFVRGIEIKGFGSALIGALVLGVVNALVRPVMVFLTFPLTIITFGLFRLVINGLMLWLVSAIVSGIRITASARHSSARCCSRSSSPACSEDPPRADGERDIEKRKRHEHARKNSGDHQGK